MLGKMGKLLRVGNTMVLVNIVFSRLATGICNRSFHRHPTLQTLSAPLLQSPASKRITPPMSTYLPYPCRRRRCTPAIEISHFPVCAASRCRDVAHQSFPPNMYATCKLDTYLRMWSRHRFSNVFCSPSRAPFFVESSSQRPTVLRTTYPATPVRTLSI